MNDYITLICGCKINPTTVIAMCGGHAQQYHYEKIERERPYSNFVREMNNLAGSPQRRGGSQ